MTRSYRPGPCPGAPAAVAILNEQAVRQLALLPWSIRVNGFAWKVPGGTGYTNVPDLAVLAPGWKRIERVTSHPPLLIVEVTSPSTRAVDQGRKLADYRLGGAELFVVVDLPAHTTYGNDGGGSQVTPTTTRNLVLRRRVTMLRLPLGTTRGHPTRQPHRSVLVIGCVLRVNIHGAMPYRGDGVRNVKPELVEKIRTAMREDRVHELMVITGEVEGALNDVLPAAEIVRRMATGAQDVLRSLARA